jgi:hypothetical protein
VSRRGSRWSLAVAFTVYPTLLLPIAVLPSFAGLATVLVGWAAANSIVDVAMNAAGVELESRGRRPMLSRLHAAQSSGLLAGGLLATGAEATRLPLAIHFGAVALCSMIAGLVATALLPAGTSRGHAPIAARPDRRLLLLGIVAFCAFLIDGGAGNWAAVDMRTEQHASATLAAATYTSLTVAVTIVRLVGDRAIARFRRALIVQASGITATSGAALVVLAPTAATALAGWILVGAGLAPLAPTVLGAAPGIGVTTPATAIAAVTTLGYLGSFSGPPLIGALAGPLTLSGAIGLLAVAAGCSVVLAPRALSTPGSRTARTAMSG